MQEKKKAASIRGPEVKRTMRDHGKLEVSCLSTLKHNQIGFESVSAKRPINLCYVMQSCCLFDHHFFFQVPEREKV